MERRHSVALTRPQTPPIRPIPIRPGAGSSAPAANVRFSPSPARAPSPALSRSSVQGPPPPRPLSRAGASPTLARPPLPRHSSYTSSSSLPRPPSPARSSTYPPPLARLGSSPPARPTSLMRSASPAASSPTRPRLSIDTGRSASLPRPPSAIYTSRRSGLATPPPSRPTSRSSQGSLRGVPPHLAFIDPSIPPLPFSPSEHPEGSLLERSNLFIARGKPRFAVAYWEQGAAYRMHQALEAYAGEMRERYARAKEGGSEGMMRMRIAVSLDVQALVEAALAVLRLLQFSEPGIQIAAQVASRLVHLRWGDTPDYHAILELHELHGIDPIVYSQGETEVVSNYTRVASGRFKGSPRLAKPTADTHSCLLRLHAAWEVEFRRPLTVTLRRLAQTGDRKAWQELQWRAEGFAQGMRATLDARRRLAREVGRLLDGVRSRSGISGDNYLEYFKRIQEFLPDGVQVVPRKELCPR